jgi:hypothetical protein
MAKRNKRVVPVETPEAVPALVRSAAWWPDALNVGVLAAMAISFAYISWGKWPDPLIDFGRELYLPWRLAQGAVLFKDELHLYGPLSPYLNSLFFRIGGVSLATLVTANAVIYSAILALLYYLVRAGWGRWAAFASCAFFVGVFSFSHLVGIDNYNFLTPYSHEMTHGTLLILCLALALRQVVRGLNALNAIAAGLLAGLSILLKPEIIFAAAAAVLAAFAMIGWRDFHRRPWKRWITGSLIFTVSGLAPMVLTGLLFWLAGGVSREEALRDANMSWFNVARGAILLKDPFQRAALGLDQPWRNIGIQTIWSGAAILLGIALALGISFFRRTGRTQKIVLVVLLLIAAAAATRVPWMNVGNALPGILLCGAAIEIVRMRSKPASEDRDDGAIARILLWTAAAAMLARMALSPRIFHYGFVQAALAGVVAVAIMVSSIPQLFNLSGLTQKWYQALMTALAAGIVVVAASNSMFFYSYHTFPVADGPDQFLGFDSTVAPAALLLEQARQFLERDAREHNVRSLLVLPEGVMLNYLTRIPNNISYYFFAPFILAEGRNEDIMQRLKASPPDRIVVISRDMREFGVGRFGESPEHGQNIIEFINDNYQAVFLFGDKDPLDPEKLGVLVFAHKNSS